MVIDILLVDARHCSQTYARCDFHARSEPFDSDDNIFGLKIDGFRSLAYVEDGQCDLVSRNDHTFRNFKDLAQWMGENLRVESAVLDGEIACVDDSGRSVFNDLLFRRRECVFFAFDLLWVKGEDLRGLSLVERKARLKKLLRRKHSRVLYVDHVEADGRLLFQQIVRMDLEGIVCKRKDSPYKVTGRGIGSRLRIRITLKLRAEMNCSNSGVIIGPVSLTGRGLTTSDIDTGRHEV
jgi:bifunctional non-homologous end joining protein LigD